MSVRVAKLRVQRFKNLDATAMLAASNHLTDATLTDFASRLTGEASEEPETDAAPAEE